MTAIGRKDRQSLQELDVHIKECRKQFDDQIKCLDSRLESKLALVTDVKEFMLKRSEIELEYSRNLERLSDRFKDRLQKQRNNYGLSKKERAAPVNLWSKLLKDTKHKARAAATMGDILCKNVATRFSDMHEEINRTSSKVKDIHTVLIDVIMRVIISLQQSTKDYYTRHSEFTTAKSKLNESETAKSKAEKEAANKKGNEKRMKQLDRSKEKRRMRYNDSLIKTTKARNEYILLVEGTKAVLSKYFDHDVSDLVSKSDHNYHNSFKCALQAYCKSELFFANSITSAADTLSLAIGIVDPDNDRLNFLEDNQILCNPERKFYVVKHSEDTITTITSVGAVHKELEKKQEDLYGKLQLMKKELAEIADVMNARRNALNDIYQQYDSEMNSQHSIDLVHPPPFLSSMPTITPVNPSIKSAKEESEHEYIYKFRELILNQKDDILRQAQYDILTVALGEISQEQKNRQQHSRDDFGSPRIIGAITGQPIKLFGTTLDSQFKQTNLEIQDLVKSCIRFISRFGLEHQGIFRVSGTSQEIADLKKSFEEGKDPLAGLNHWKDINAVAGVLRAYFRELEEPLFPSKFCDDYIRISRLQSTDEQIQETALIIEQFPPLNLHIIKYLFNFLNQVSLRSERNKMPPHNLSVVFGPTVVHAPATAELITNQGQINIFIEFLISEFFSIFPNERPLNNDGTMQSDDENEDGIDDDGDVSDVTDDENDDDFSEAEALYDYCARSHKELSFKKGDIIRVFARANKDWLDARVDGACGFVPANYVKFASDSERLDISSDDPLSGFSEAQNRADSSTEEPLSLDEKILSPRSDDALSQSDTPRSTSSVTEHKETKGNFFNSIDPTVPKGTSFKSSSLGPKSTSQLSGPQPFQNKTSSLQRGTLKNNADVFQALDSHYSTGFQSKESFGAQKMLRPSVKGLAISAQDLKSTQSRLRPGTPDDALAGSEVNFEEKPIPLDRGGGSVKNISHLFGAQTGASSPRKPLSSTASDESLTSPLSDESRRFGGDGRPPAPAVKPKPMIRKDSSNVLGGQGGAGPPDLIASIKAAAAAKVVKDGVKEETNL